MTIRMQEAEAVLKFSKVMEHVRRGDSVQLEKDGAATALIQEPAAKFKVRHVEEVVARLRAAERDPALRISDPTFGDDLQAAHDSVNQPLDASRWN